MGTLKGFNQTINLNPDETHKRILSATQGVEQVVLGLHIIRGDNICVRGETEDTDPGHPQKRPPTSVGAQAPQLSQPHRPTQGGASPGRGRPPTGQWRRLPEASRRRRRNKGRP